MFFIYLYNPFLGYKKKDLCGEITTMWTVIYFHF